MPLKYKHFDSDTEDCLSVFEKKQNEIRKKKKKKKWKPHQTVLLKRLIRVYGLGRISIFLPYFYDKTMSDINTKIRILTKTQNISQFNSLKIDTDKVGIMNTLLCLLEEKNAILQNKRPRTLLKCGQRKNQAGKMSKSKKERIFNQNCILYDEEPPEDLVIFNLRDHMEIVKDEMKKRNEYNINLKNRIEEMLRMKDEQTNLNEEKK